ncbi:MAG: glycosyltransferase [Candidatus Woesearchaeota archaeon]
MIKYSIVVPVAPYRSAEVLGSLKELDYPKNKYEVLVFEGPNPSINRNKGIKAAKGEIILFLDDDAVISKDLLKRADEFFERCPEVDIMGGPQLTPKDDPLFAKISGEVIACFLATFKMCKRYKRGKLDLEADEKVITSAICFAKRGVFDKVGGFDPKLFPGEEPVLLIKAKKEGFKIAYNPEIFIYHRRRPTLKGFFKQFFLYGKTAVSRGTIVNYMPTLFVFYLILLIPLQVFSFLFLIPLFVYLFLIIINSFFIAIKNKKITYLPVSFVLFFLTHIAYGLGYFVGKIRS